MIKREVAAVVTHEFQAVSLPYELEHGAKHPRVRFHMSGRRYTYVLPGSASDHRAIKNLRSGLRRLIRQAMVESDLPLAG